MDKKLQSISKELVEYGGRQLINDMKRGGIPTESIDEESIDAYNGREIAESIIYTLLKHKKIKEVKWN